MQLSRRTHVAEIMQAQRCLNKHLEKAYVTTVFENALNYFDDSNVVNIFISKKHVFLLEHPFEVPWFEIFLRGVLLLMQDLGKGWGSAAQVGILMMQDAGQSSGFDALVGVSCRSNRGSVECGDIHDSACAELHYKSTGPGHRAAAWRDARPYGTRC